MHIGFHLTYDFHHAMLDPIYALLRDEYPCLMAKDAKAIIDFKPKVLALADAHYHYFRGKLPGTIIIWVRHGFSNKNHVSRCISGSDFACVSSPWMRDEYIRMGARPRLGYWVTGFVPMDKALVHSKHFTPSLLPKNFSQGRATLLYAPTWNNYLNSVEVLGDQWLDTLGRSMPHINVIIKPHPHIPTLFPRWMAMWRAAARRNKQTILIEDSNADIYEYLSSADILLSDASSVIFYFLAFNRPIILVNNPQRFKDQIYFNPAGHEWTWRDMGIPIDHREELPHALQRCLQYPEEFSKQRTLYRKRIFGNLLDGRAAERIANRIRSLCNPRLRDKQWVTSSWDAASAFSSLDKKRLVLLNIRLFLTPLRKSLRRYPRIFLPLKKALQWLSALYINESKGREGGTQ
ncbi:MAG: hypothetical protein A2Z08_09875 [Deltaproteobacteria bacterium RBG_16_54_11]|nr:MAG: hypothetical protein A2Z08_09875 [Deltaproteobacteria bacterium RBG_16_54_11]